MPDENHKVFLAVIEALRRRPNPMQELTQNQIASVALGNGKPTNSAKVGGMLRAYRAYFISSGYGPARKYIPRWADIDRDFPPNGPPPTGVSPFAEMIRALEDEERAVRREITTHPIAVFEGRRVPELETGTDVIYRLTYWRETDDGYFPIPDGVPVQLLWHGREVREGVLLSEDGANWQLYVALDRPLDPAVAVTRGEIRPKLEELVAAVRRRVMVARDDASGLQHRLLESPVATRQVRSIEVTGGLLDPSQRDAVARACCNDVTFIWGPPGTGKTHTLGEVLARLAASGLRTLALSIANVAVDQVCLKARDALERHGLQDMMNRGEVLRVGRAREPEVLRDRRFFPDQEEARRIAKAIAACQEELKAPRVTPERRARIQKDISDLRAALRGLIQRYLKNARLVFTTVLQPCLDATFDEIGQFDVVVVDEASMLPIPHLMASASRAASQLVIVGDFRQLGPIALSNSEVAHRWLHRDAFDLIKVSEQVTPTHETLAMLQHQRRMHPDISRCINARFYGGLLVDAAVPQTTRAVAVSPRVGHGVAFVDISGEADCYVEKTGAGSRKNQGSAMRAASLAGALASRHNDVEIAIITPYRAQVVAIREQLKKLKVADVRSRIRVGTIHTFQGSERDIVIWDWVDNRKFHVGLLYRDREGDRLANVAISRAKGKLLVLGDPRTFHEAPGHESVRSLKAIVFQGLEPHQITWREASDALGLSGTLS